MATLKDLFGDRIDENKEINVEVHLKAVVAEQSSSVTFTAKVVSHFPIRSTWYKNGEELFRNPRYRISVRQNLHSLKIPNVLKSDVGIFTVVCLNQHSYVSSQATLHVVPKSRQGMPCRKNRGAVFLPWPTSKTHISLHLKSVKVNFGDPVILRVEIFSSDESIQPLYTWMKNDRICNSIFDAGTELINSDNNGSEFVKYNTEVKDSGTYTVVISSEDILLSSSAEVIVMEPLTQGMSNTTNPCFIQPLPDELDGFETEEVTMVCKTALETTTEVFFYKDGTKLEEDPNIKLEEIERGIRINIQRATVKDSGIYNVVLRDKNSGNIANTQCILCINPAPRETLPIVEISRPLSIAISYIGNRVCLYCRFDLPKKHLYSVVWRVGFYLVERTTPEFQLLSTEEGHYLLLIRKLEPDMFGEVSCQLQCIIPTNKKRITLRVTKGVLVNIHPDIMEEETIGNCDAVQYRIYAEVDMENSAAVFKAADRSDRRRALPSTSNVDPDEGKQDEAAALPVPSPEDKYPQSTIPKAFQSAKLASTTLMELLYCRLKADRAHFLMIENCHRSPMLVMADLKSNDIMLQGLSNTEQMQSNEVIEIEWLDGCAPRTENWYAIETEQASGEYYLAGITSHPKITLNRPTPGKMTRFRIRIIEALESIPEASFVISPPIDVIVQPIQAPHRPIEEFKERYTKIGEPIGIGAYGAVYLVRSKDGGFMAAKIVKTRTEKRRDSTRREIEIMKRLHHRQIVQLHVSYYSRDQMIIVMDYLWGGELFERIVEEENFKEQTAVHYIHQICDGLEYLHNQRIVHLDIKPENIVCISRNSRDIKIVDFGLSRVLEKNLVRAIYGTRDYIAPEVLSFEAIQPASDMWSLGVVTYVMLSGTVPFNGDNWAERAAAITMGNFNFKDPAFDTVTDEAKEFIQALLVLKPEDRLTAKTAKQHPWMAADTVDYIGVSQTQRWRSNLRNYLETNKARWQRAGNVVIAANRLLTGVHREMNLRLADAYR